MGLGSEIRDSEKTYSGSRILVRNTAYKWVCVAVLRAEIGLTINWIRTHLEEDPQARPALPLLTWVPSMPAVGKSPSRKRLEQFLIIFSSLSNFLVRIIKKDLIFPLSFSQGIIYFFFHDCFFVFSNLIYLYNLFPYLSFRFLPDYFTAVLCSRYRIVRSLSYLFINGIVKSYILSLLMGVKPCFFPSVSLMYISCTVLFPLGHRTKRNG